jgi:drug/metabolite transporter (DMT)-like permease
MSSRAVRRRTLGEHRRGQIAVALAATAWSSAGILQRELTVGATTQVAGRAAFAFVTLLAYVVAVERRGAPAAFRAIGREGLGVAVCMAVASGLFILALNHTTVARVLFIQAAAPMAAALLGRVLLAEPVAPRTWAAMLVALAGVALMIGGPGGVDAAGDGAALVMMAAFAVAIVLTRRRRHVSMTPATCLAQLLLVLVFVPLSQPGQVGGADLGYLVALGVGQMGVGLALFAAGARRIPAAEVALLTLLEVVLGPLWVWLALAERPGAATLAGGAVVIVAVVVQASAERPLPGPAVPPPP